MDPVAAADGVLRPPADPQRVGWWSSGARPAARRGATLLTGHAVRDGDGALDRLPELRPGDRVELVLEPGKDSGAGQAPTYRVESVTPYDREDLARQAAGLFGTSGPPSLVLVTCIDFDGVSYRGNVVVVARPGGGR